MDVHKSNIYAEIFDVLPLGLVIVDDKHQIHAWNKWMVNNTGITESKAVGESLLSFYPNNIQFRFKSALEHAIQDGYPQVLSSILNQYVIPISLDKQAYPDLSFMQQNVEVLPIIYAQQNMALIIIQDVSDKVHLRNTLLSMAAKFEKNSLLDTLTGLYNRRFLWKYLENELKVAQRDNYSVFCCLYDIDHFKKINDEYGHVVGDQVLVAFAELARTTVRPSDYLFRYGGEEFIIILTRIKDQDAFSISERLRILLEKTAIHSMIKENITCSGGIAHWQPGNPLMGAEKLIDDADHAMYKAKSGGRNRIIMNTY